MNFSKALKLMKEGKKIRHAKWDEESYWYMKDDQLYDEQSTEITSLIDDYLFYNQWEIYDPTRKLSNLTFGKALEYVMQGKKISRYCWHNNDIYIYKCKTTENYIYDPHLMVQTCRRTHSPWVPNQGEIFATDWKVLSDD